MTSDELKLRRPYIGRDGRHRVIQRIPGVLVDSVQPDGTVKQMPVSRAVLSAKRATKTVDEWMEIDRTVLRMLRDGEDPKEFLSKHGVEIVYDEEKNPLVVEPL